MGRSQAARLAEAQADGEESMTERRAIHKLRDELYRARVLLDHAAEDREQDEQPGQTTNRFRSGYQRINELLDETDHLKATPAELKEWEAETFSKLGS